MHELRREEEQLDDLLEVLEQSRDGILTNRDHLYVSYGDIGQTGVADNNKILAVQHPLDTNITKDVTWVSSYLVEGLPASHFLLCSTLSPRTAMANFVKEG